MQNRPYGGGPPRRDTRQFDPEATRVQRIFAGDTAELVSYAEDKARELLGFGLTTSQIRNILDEVQHMSGFDEDRLQLLRPKLAYASGRHDSVKPLRAIFEECIRLTNKDNFKTFKNLVEALVAYHRCHGGK
jgi:CRISPR-associated protein Csm2